MKARTIFPIAALAGAILLVSGCGGRSGTAAPASPGVSGEATAAGAPGAGTPGAAAPSPAGGAPVTASPGSSTGAPSGSAAPSPGGAEGPGAPSPAAAVPGAVGPGAPGPATPAGSPRRVGEIAYAEGTVTLHRGGEAPRAADFGDLVENFDVLQTGPKSRATVELDPGRPGGAEIRLAENTAFYFESALTDDRARKTILQLLAGSVAVKVEKLADGGFHVGTDGAVLGVRGTTFIVNTIPDGSLLVTCAEGRVEVTDDAGERAYAQPGRVVSQKAGEPVREDLVSLEGLADFRVTWVDESLADLESRAPRVLAGFARRYTETLPAFDAAFDALKTKGPVLDAWSVAREAGGEPKFTDWVPEKKAVAPVLFDCLAALFKLERPFYRLQELSAYHDRGVGAGVLPDGRTTADFYGTYRARAAEVSERMAYVRRALLLFKYASAGSPLGQFFGSKADALGSGGLFLED